MATIDDSHFNIGDMKVPTIYSSVRGDIIVYIVFMPLSALYSEEYTL